MNHHADDDQTLGFGRFMPNGGELPINQRNHKDWQPPDSVVISWPRQYGKTTVSKALEKQLGAYFFAKGYMAALERDIEATRRIMQVAHDQLEQSLEEVTHVGIDPETIRKIGRAMIDELTEPLPRHHVSITRINHHWKDKTL